MKNPIYNLYEHLPADGSKILITKELCVQILAWMRAADPKFSELRHVDELLKFMHREGVITLSYVEVSGDECVNFIQRKIINGN